ncbi:MAG: methyltransferase MtaB domain-containing protein [Phycisphaeraceae bacterium]
MYDDLAINEPADLLFGHAPRPVQTRSGLTIGAGVVYPEFNFTLPAMTVTAEAMPRALEHYRRMIREGLERAVRLEVPGMVVEFETLPPMTEHPDWARQICELLLAEIAEVRHSHGLRTALRATPNDTREMVRPPVMRSGELYEQMLRTFELCGDAGADMLSIESVGGKEIHDEALQAGDLGGILFSLCVLGVADMRFLWPRIVDIAGRTGSVPAGDTACGFANTAMALAEQKMIPGVLAAVDRAVSAVRSLAAYECGALGPGKDCGYENIILKAITGLPMAMEGKSATCAHLSPMGNVAAAAADLWSNESVHPVKLLAGPAPTAFLESLVYDCRLLNEALHDGRADAGRLRDWLVRSDARHDPQAYVLTPDAAVRIGRAIVAAPDPYRAGRAAAQSAIDLMREGFAGGELALAPREAQWLDMLESMLQELPEEPGRFIEQQLAAADRSRFLPEEYDLDLALAPKAAACKPAS